jgi:hypothetical protein
LSNRALLVNDLGWYAHPSVVYAGSRVVSVVGMKPPHDGRSRVRPPRVLCAVRIGRNEATGMASPTLRQGHPGVTSGGGTNTVSFVNSGYSLSPFCGRLFQAYPRAFSVLVDELDAARH